LVVLEIARRRGMKYRSPEGDGCVARRVSSTGFCLWEGKKGIVRTEYTGIEVRFGRGTGRSVALGAHRPSREEAEHRAPASGLVGMQPRRSQKKDPARDGIRREPFTRIRVDVVAPCRAAGGGLDLSAAEAVRRVSPVPPPHQLRKSGLPLAEKKNVRDRHTRKAGKKRRKGQVECPSPVKHEPRYPAHL